MVMVASAGDRGDEAHTTGQGRHANEACRRILEELER